jgi:glutaredoxin/glutathione-dependent peroxiredoxin
VALDTCRRSQDNDVVNPRHPKEKAMAIKVGDRLPDGTLTEMIDTERPGCTVGPNNFAVSDISKGKKIVIFAVPGAFTPTCSAKHVPSYVQGFDKLRAKGVDELWCIAVNDAFVMGAWGRDQKAGGKIRMMADGSAIFTKALGLDMDLTARGMGVRSQRYSMLVDNGVVKALNVEQPGKFEVSDADTMLKSC